MGAALVSKGSNVVGSCPTAFPPDSGPTAGVPSVRFSPLALAASARPAKGDTGRTGVALDNGMIVPLLHLAGLPLASLARADALLFPHAGASALFESNRVPDAAKRV